jgi:type VI protein secretion system component VasK
MKSLSKPTPEGKSIWWSLYAIWTATFLVAISVVCFYGPVIDSFGEWLGASIVNRIYSFMIGLALLTIVLMWIKFRKS